LRTSIVEQRREELAREIREVEEEFRAREGQPCSAKELMEEILERSAAEDAPEGLLQD
jgi:hypothetical protein